MVSHTIFNRFLAQARRQAGCWRLRGGLAIAAQFLAAPAWAEGLLGAGFFGDIAAFVALAVLLPVALIGAAVWRLRASLKTQPAAQAPKPLEPADVADLPSRPAAVLSLPVKALVDESDLIQQADYLSLLGECDAAVALLSARIESAESAEAPVWIKLMQIHRRFGDRHSFERLRAPYALRFGTEAPLWARNEVDLMPASSLCSQPAGHLPDDAAGRSPAVGHAIPGSAARDVHAGDAARMTGR